MTKQELEEVIKKTEEEIDELEKMVGPLIDDLDFLEKEIDNLHKLYLSQTEELKKMMNEEKNLDIPEVKEQTAGTSTRFFDSSSKTQEISDGMIDAVIMETLFYDKEKGFLHMTESVETLRQKLNESVQKKRKENSSQMN